LTKEKTMRVHIDAKVCEGHGRCYVLSPLVFAADEEGNGEVLVEELDSPDLIAAADLASKNCPEGAITVSDGA
jgi:ferredoxin